MIGDLTDSFARWQVAQCSLQFQFAGNQHPHILFQYIAVNIGLLLTIFEESTRKL